MKTACRFGWYLVLLAILLAVPSAAKLNTQYLVPSGNIHIDQSQLTRPALKICALTFDDGPDERYTMQVLRILNEFNIKGTFFLIGEKVKTYPDQVRQIALSGHEIGNHSYTHPDMTALSTAEQRRQLQLTCDALTNLGIDATWFRPPYGRAGRVALSLADELGMDVIRWSVDPQDWSEPGVATIQSRVLKQTVPGGVILLHSTNQQTVAALPGLITELLDRGYTFATMSQWRAAVTGKSHSITPVSTTHAASGAVTEVTALYEINDPFYQAYAPYQASTETAIDISLDTPAPAVPANRGVVAEGAVPPVTDRLTVYTNFQQASAIQDVPTEGGSRTLYAYAPAPAVARRAPAPAANGLLQGGVDVRTAMPRTEPALTALLAPPILDPMPALEIDLERGSQLAAQWIAPDFITATDLDRPPSPTPAGPGGTIPARYFLLVNANDAGQTPWTGLEKLVSQARLDGLVLPTASFFGTPPARLACPWTFAGPDRIAGLPQVELTSGCSGELLRILAAGHSNVLVVPPVLDTAASAEGVAELLLFRQLTAGLPLAGSAVQLEAWSLPSGVRLLRFANDRRQAVIIVNDNSDPVDLAVPAAFTHFSRATLSPAAQLLLVPDLPVSLSIDRQPVFLYYDLDVSQ